MDYAERLLKFFEKNVGSPWNYRTLTEIFEPDDLSMFNKALDGLVEQGIVTEIKYTNDYNTYMLS